MYDSQSPRITALGVRASFVASLTPRQKGSLGEGLPKNGYDRRNDSEGLESGKRKSTNQMNPQKLGDRPRQFCFCPVQEHPDAHSDNSE